MDFIQDAFSFDGLVTSHPVYVPVSDPAQINEIFDTISYQKVRILFIFNFLGSFIVCFTPISDISIKIVWGAKIIPFLIDQPLCYDEVAL